MIHATCESNDGDGDGGVAVAVAVALICEYVNIIFSKRV